MKGITIEFNEDADFSDMKMSMLEFFPYFGTNDLNYQNLINFVSERSHRMPIKIVFYSIDKEGKPIVDYQQQ